MFGSIAGAVVGGLISDRNSRRSQERAQSYEKPKKVRRRYEQAGLNPLLAFGGGAGTVAPSMGQSTAWGELLGNGIESIQNHKIQQAKLAQENERLKLIAQELALKEQPRPYPAKNSSTGVGGGVKRDVQTAQTDVQPIKSPLTFGDDKAHHETVLGVRMPWDAADRNTAAGGEIAGEIQTGLELIGRGFTQRQERAAKASGQFTFRSNGQVYQLGKPPTYNDPILRDNSGAGSGKGSLRR